MRLACIAVPNFRIALERARVRGLAGRAIAIGEPPPGANEVLDCSPEAAASGIRTGMPLRDARTLLPALQILPPDPVHYARSFETLLDALEGAEPAVEPGEDGVAFAAIDPHAGEDAVWAAAARLVRTAREGAGVEASAGVAEGKFIAWCAATVSAAGEATIVPAGRERDFVAPLSTSFLPVTYEAQRKFALYGLRTIGDVARLSLPAAQAQFGREGRRIHELARGIDTAPFLPRARREPVAGTLAMPAPTVNSAALLIAARQLAGRLLQLPAMRFRQVRQLRLRLLLLDGLGSWERTLTFREPLGDEEAIVFVLKKLIEPLQLAGPVEEMALEFIGLTSETGKQRSLLFAEQSRRRAQLLAALRQLKAQFGESQVVRVVEVEPWSRIPERRYALIDYDL